MKTARILAALVALSLPSCMGLSQFGEAAGDVANRTEIGLGVTTKDGWMYGPIKARVIGSDAVESGK